jgi:SAM-dependent methyltransferase
MSTPGTNHMAQAKALGGMVLATLRREGVAGVAKRCASQFQQLWSDKPLTSAFDQEYGTDTDGIVPLWKLGIASANYVDGVHYQPSDPQLVREALERLPVRLSDFVFVDIGSGKGRVLLIAAAYPFKYVLGIEFSPELHAIANENLLKLKARRRCSEVRSVCADVVDYSLPAEKLALFLYNPFGADVMARFLKNLKGDLAARDRQIYLIYLFPTQRALVEQSGLFERLDLAGPIYRHLPPK